MNILARCSGNSARSILLDSILTHRSGGRSTAFSAGSKPSGKVHPQSLALLTDKGFPTDGLASQSWDDDAADCAPVMDAVITVCGSAADEPCPIWLGVPLRAYWGVKDPAAAAETDLDFAFTQAYTRLTKRAEMLFALPFEDMALNALQAALNNIGKQH